MSRCMVWLLGRAYVDFVKNRYKILPDSLPDHAHIASIFALQMNQIVDMLDKTAC